MNASCALQHFCDLHGPQILLFTEERTYIHDLNDNDNESLKAFYAQYLKSEHIQDKVKCQVRTKKKYKNNLLKFLLFFSHARYHRMVFSFRQKIY